MSSLIINSAEDFKMLMTNVKAKMLLLLGVSLVLMCAVGFEKKQPPKKDIAEVIPVRAMKVALRDLNKMLEYVGDIKAQDEALVYPKVTGKISEKVKEDGASVSKGDAIAYIDRDEVGLKFEKAPVESPLSGIVGRVYVDIGSNVSAQTPVALVVSMDTVKIDLNIPEKYLPALSLGQEARVTVDAYPEEEFIGSVTKISPVLDLETRTAPIQILIDNKEHRLKSGMFAKVKLIIDRHKNVPTILKEAIMGKTPDCYVYVIENNKAVYRRVTMGIREGAYFEILDGLKENESVVIIGQQRLKDGALVNVEE
ncbi:MAG: efflux RND transporter periplasmic adaptor subunit [Candidatus Omnitrophota bacterium]